MRTSPTVDPGWLEPTPGRAWFTLPRVAVLSYLGATLLGLVMRFEFVGLGTGIAFDHLLHAHSHALYFGWMGLGLLAASLPIFDPTPLRRTVRLLVVLVPVMAAGFLAMGYHPVTIAVSTIVMFAWYVVMVVWWRGLGGLESIAALAYRYGIVYLGLASLGIWALAVVQASNGPALAEDLAIHAFLLGFGWFVVFGVVGSLMAARDRLGLSFSSPRLRFVLHAWGSAAWATFALGVSGGPEVWRLGPVARLAGVFLLVPAALFIGALSNASTERPIRRLMRLAALWFAVATVTTAGAAVGGTAALDAVGRQGVVIHLHATFVGFVTPLLVVVLAAAIPRGLLAHHGSLAVMLSGLGVAASGKPVLGMWIAAVAAVALWLAGAVWSRAVIGSENRAFTVAGHAP